LQAAWKTLRYTLSGHGPVLVAVAIGALASSVLAMLIETVGGLSSELWVNVLAVGLVMTVLAAAFLSLSIRNGQKVALRLTERSAELSQRTFQLLESNQILEGEILERKQAESAAERANKRLVDAIGSIADGFLLWDAEDRLVLSNEKFTDHEILPSEVLVPGMPFEEFIRESYGAIARSESDGSIESWMDKRRTRHREASGAFDFRLRDGRWMQVSERRTKDGATVTIYTDITQQRRAEYKLKRSEGRLAHAERLAGIGCWEWTRESNELVWSAELFTLMNWPNYHAPTVTSYLELVHKDDRDDVEKAYRDIFLHGGSFDIEYRITRPDGVELQFKSQGEAAMGEDNVAERIIGAVHDITELKRTEEALLEAKEAAELANRSKSEFLANMSHEVRTPLNAIMGFSEVMKDEIFGSIGNLRYREYAEDIQLSGTHLLHLINEILDLSRVEAGKLELFPETVEIDQIVQSSVRLIKERAETGGLSLSVTVAPDLPEMFADERKLKQIFLNLLTNAVKFTPEVGRVTINADNDGQGGISVSVADTGIGMSNDEIPKALTPFGQIDSALTRKVDGTGLGLPLTKALIELHGGWLEIQSAKGVGTNAIAHLPLMKKVA
jgi:signal transduction histidine kinase